MPQPKRAMHLVTLQLTPSTTHTDFIEMQQVNRQPFVNFQALNKDNSSYVPFLSQTDAMLASLQMFHDVPCRIMNLVIFIVTHSDFDAKQVTLRNSMDVLSIVEESLVKDATAVVDEKSLPSFIDVQALNQRTKTYVKFPSRTDALLASLQLFHMVSHSIMDLVFSMVTHPDFDVKQVTLRSSVDVINVAEENRLKDRMAVICERSINRDDRVEQAGFPQFVLDEVLDIIHTERMNSIDVQFEETLNAKDMYRYSMHIKEDDTLKTLCLVHRSWTLPAQKALGRVLHIGRPTHEMDVLLSPVQKSIFGPWTSTVAIQLYHPIVVQKHARTISGTRWLEYNYASNDQQNCRQSYEALHRIFISFVNLKCIYIKSYAPFFTEWSNYTIRDLLRKNSRLRELTLYANRKSKSDPLFDLDPLVEHEWTIGNLRSFKIQGAAFSDEVREYGLRRFSIARCASTIRSSEMTLRDDLALFSVLSTHPTTSDLELTLYDINPIDWRRSQSVTHFDCSTSFHHLHALHVDSPKNAEEWLTLIARHCSNLEDLTILTNVTMSPQLLNLIPATIQSLNLRLLRERWPLDVAHFRQWTTKLLKLLTAGHFLELNSFIFSISKDTSFGYSEADKREHSKSHREVENFDKEMNSVCKASGVVYKLQILAAGQLRLPYTVRCSF